MTIHRKKTLEFLRAKQEEINDPVFEAGLQLAEAQDTLISRLGTDLKNSRKAYRELQSAHERNVRRIEALEKELTFYKSKSVTTSIQRDDAVRVVKDLHDLMKSLGRFQANHPTALMSITEKIEAHKEK